MKIKFLAPVLLALAFSFAMISFSPRVALSQSSVPRFKDYPAGEIYKGPIAPLVLKRDDLTFKSRLRWAAKNQKPNFAGHYILTTWGCGAQCVMGAVIDAKTGKVYWWSFSTCCWGSDTDDRFNPIEFRPDSRLIVFSGLRNEKDGDDGAHFYRFDDRRFVHIRSVSNPVSNCSGLVAHPTNRLNRSGLIDAMAAIQHLVARGRRDHGSGCGPSLRYTTCLINPDGPDNRNW